MMGDKVILKTAAGKQLKIPVAGLSAADRKYLAALIPPTIKIEVDVDKDRKTLESYSSDYGSFGYERKSETIKCDVELTKTNREECSGEFTAYIYVFSESIGLKRTQVLAVSDHKFNFKSSKKTSFSSEAATVKYEDSSEWGKEGYRYSGYVVFVVNAQGGLVVANGTSGGYEKNALKIKKAKKGSYLDRKFDLMKNSRN